MHIATTILAFLMSVVTVVLAQPPQATKDARARVWEYGHGDKTCADNDNILHAHRHRKHHDDLGCVDVDPDTAALWVHRAPNKGFFEKFAIYAVSGCDEEGRIPAAVAEGCHAVDGLEWPARRRIRSFLEVLQ